MWNEPNEILDLVNIGQYKRNLVHRIMVMLKLPLNNILIVFDNSNYEGYINLVWGKNQAHHMNLAAGGLEEMSPKHLLELMERKSHAHFVWFSKRVSLAKPVEFAWVFGHEMQHVFQDIRSHLISRASYFLIHTLKEIDIEEEKIISTVPAEFDADKTARMVVTELFGEDVRVGSVVGPSQYAEMTKKESCFGVKIGLKGSILVSKMPF